MNADLALPIVASIACLVIVVAGLASHRLGWRRMLAGVIAWAAIFTGAFLLVECFMATREAASGLL